eukprot:3569386-Pyramimonas_sp.AAC.1
MRPRLDPIRGRMRPGDSPPRHADAVAHVEGGPVRTQLDPLKGHATVLSQPPHCRKELMLRRCPDHPGPRHQQPLDQRDRVGVIGLPVQ